MKQLLAITTFVVVVAWQHDLVVFLSRKPVLAITHVTVIDATGAQPRQDMTVVIIDERVAVLGPYGSTAIPRRRASRQCYQ